MKKVDVCFVAIGIRSMGYGHVTRAIEIFDLFRTQTNTVCLIRTDDDGLLLVPAIPGLHAFTSEEGFLSKLGEIRSSLAVCDFLSASVEVMSIIITNSSRIASVSPISNVNEVADVVVTRAPVSGAVKGVNYYGSQFAIAHSRKIQDRPKPLSIGVNFGGSDPEDQLSEFVREISRTDQRLDLTLMLGPGYRGRFASIFDSLIVNKSIDFSVHQSASKFWEILEFQDVLVLSGGLSLYEAIHKKLPAIVLVPEIDKLALIPEDLKDHGVPWIAQTIGECIGKLDEIYHDRQIVEQQKARLRGIDFSRNTENVVEALAKYVE